MTDHADIDTPHSGLSAVLPLAAVALVFAAVIVFYGTNGGTFSTADRNTPAVVHSTAPATGSSTVR